MKKISFVCHVIWIAALGWIVTARSQDFPRAEFTLVCHECVYGVSWEHPDTNIRFHELFLPDPTHPDGIRRIFKGASKSAYVTVSGSQTAKLRSCFSVHNCSTFVELQMIPENKLPDQGLMNKIRITSPIELLHESSSVAANPAISRRVYELRSVLLDFTATGQRGCEKGVGRRKWNIGTRMTITISPDNVFEVRNRSIVEHDDGFWTWTGDITGDHVGTVTITANDCKELAFVSIVSDRGIFAIQPMTAPEHIAYRVDPSQAIDDCSYPIHEQGSPLIKFEDELDVDLTGSVEQHVTRSRQVRFDFDEFDAHVAPLLILLGADRDHDAANFVDTTARLELFPSVETKFDFRHGELVSGNASNWQWRGCKGGDPESQIQLLVDKINRNVFLVVSSGKTITSMQSMSNGLHRIVEIEQ